MFPNSSNIRLSLLSLDLIQNNIGGNTYKYTSSKEVIGINFSITSREYYESKRANIKVSFGVKIQSFIYNNETHVVYKEKVYKIERTYQVGQFIELYLVESNIEVGDIIDYPR